MVGVFLLVLCAVAWMQASAARAITVNTITQTAITSPSDPSYFYDPTAGAYGAIKVTGTTNSTNPSSDQVDIDCYSDDGTSATWQDTVASGVTLNSDGSFSATVPYSALEQNGDNMCRLRAVPAGSSPMSGLGSFSGPRVLLSTLSVDYYGSGLGDFNLVAPQLGATNVYNSSGDCGLQGAYLNDPTIFGQEDLQSFTCADTTGLSWLDGGAAEIQVDGNDAAAAYNGDPALTVAATQNPANGNMTISETDPIDVGCFSSGCVDSGIQESRTIQQAASGHVVEITDRFSSTDGAAHTVALDVASEQCFTSSYCSSFDPSQVGYEFPGESGFSTHANGDTVAVGSQSPASIYVQGSSAPVDGAITYFTPPSGPFRFAQTYWTYWGWIGNIMLAPYELNVPAGGSAQVSFAYSTEASQDALAPDIQTARDLQSLPTVTISSPAPGSTTSSASVTVAGQVTATTGVSSVTVNGVSAALSGSSFSATVPLTAGANTITAVVTTDSGVTASASESVTYTPASSAPVTPAAAGKWAGATWLPIANTGAARRAGTRRERLSGRVTAGSAGVRYFFEYGIGGHLTHHSRTMSLAAGKSSRHVSLTIGGLDRGAKYQYRLVATGRYGHAVGRGRTFRVAKRGNR